MYKYFLVFCDIDNKKDIFVGEVEYPFVLNEGDYIILGDNLKEECFPFFKSGDLEESEFIVEKIKHFFDKVESNIPMVYLKSKSQKRMKSVDKL